MLREIVRGIGFWQCALERGGWGGGQDGLVQDPTLKCLKSIHTEPRGVQWGGRERVGEGGKERGRERGEGSERMGGEKER